MQSDVAIRNDNLILALNHNDKAAVVVWQVGNGTAVVMAVLCDLDFGENYAVTVLKLGGAGDYAVPCHQHCIALWQDVFVPSFNEDKEHIGRNPQVAERLIAPLMPHWNCESYKAYRLAYIVVEGFHNVGIFVCHIYLFCNNRNEGAL